MNRMIRTIVPVNTKYSYLHNFKRISRPKYVLTNKSASVIFENTFVYWILQYFKTSEKYETHSIENISSIPERGTKKVFNKVEFLSAINTDDLLTLMLNASKNKVPDYSAIKLVDEELCKRLTYKDVEYTEILRITDTILYFTRNKKHLASFSQCIEYIKNLLANKEVPLQHFIQCMFYASVLKDDPLARATMLLILAKIHNQIGILDAISSVELAIFCNSIYKTSTKIKSKRILAAIVEAIDKDLDTLFRSEQLCVSVMKPLHQAKYNDYTFLDKIAHKIMNEKCVDLSTYSNTTNVYLFKLYSNALYSDENFIKYMTDLILLNLNDVYKNKQNIRIKDLSILLKSFCELGYDFFKKQIIDDIVPILYKIIDTRTLKSRAELRCLGEILLWINILDTSILDQNFINSIIDPSLVNIGKQGAKGTARMNLLLSILSVEKILLPEKEIELKEMMVPTEPHSESQMFNSQPKLYDIYQSVQCLSVTNKNLIKDFSFGCQVPYLYMPGITVQTFSGHEIAIESLDNKVCLHGTLIPHGYMKLKFRLLKKLGYDIITVPQNTTDKGSEHLIVSIEDNIKQIEDVYL